MPVHSLRAAALAAALFSAAWAGAAPLLLDEALALAVQRSQLTRWREQLSGAQSANSTRIATLKDQIAALGAVPAEGVTEDPEIDTRRTVRQMAATSGR